MTTLEIVEQICMEKWDSAPVAPQEQLEVINAAADKFIADGGVEDAEEVMDDINSFALWIGGLDLNLQVYAWQLIRRHSKIAIYADSKTHERMSRLEEKVFLHTPYRVINVDNVAKFNWPKVFLDGSTFEERMEAVLEDIDTDLDSEELTGDIVLSGRATGPAEHFEENARVLNEAYTELKRFLEKYDKPNILYHEKVNNLLTWLMSCQIEVAIMALRSILCIWCLPIDEKKTPVWDEFNKRVSGFITGA